MRAGIAIGSNLGDRISILNEAIGHLRLLHVGGDFLISSLHETTPIDCPPESPSFLNGVVELETSLPPRELLHCLQHLEEKAGRPRLHERHAPRTLDLDLLYCDEMTLQTSELQLPHPRMTERLFVMAPLAEIRPTMKLPSWSITAQEYLYYIRKN